jgi:hypothetical protein
MVALKPSQPQTRRITVIGSGAEQKEAQARE